jgi:hypothetical protein
LNIIGEGNWKKNLLYRGIELSKKKGYVCYWAGAFGHIWHITDCWIQYYDLKFWSNVACVNVNHAPTLLNKMEDGFQHTLHAGGIIKYDDACSANTDGCFQNVNKIFD